MHRPKHDRNYDTIVCGNFPPGRDPFPFHLHNYIAGITRHSLWPIICFFSLDGISMGSCWRPACESSLAEGTNRCQQGSCEDKTSAHQSLLEFATRRINHWHLTLFDITCPCSWHFHGIVWPWYDSHDHFFQPNATSESGQHFGQHTAQFFATACRYCEHWLNLLNQCSRYTIFASNINDLQSYCI